MKFLFITSFLISAAFAQDPSNLRAGVIQKGAGIPTFTNAYSFPVSKFKDHLCKSNDGGVQCEWKKLNGSGRYSLVRTNIDEITGKRTVINFVFEQTDDVLYLTRMVHNDVDVDRRAFAEASRTMAVLNLEFKEANKQKKTKVTPKATTTTLPAHEEPESTPNQSSSSW